MFAPTPIPRRPRLAGALLFGSVALLGTGCTEASAPTDASPPPVPATLDAPAPTGTGPASSEAAYAFAFLAPLGEGPGEGAGALAAHLAPEVDVCADPACAGPMATFSTAGSGNARVRVDSEGDHFVVHWRPADTGTPAGSTVTIRVRIGDAVLGAAEAHVVAPGPVAGGAGGPPRVLRTQAFAIRFAVTGAPAGPEPDGDAVSAIIGEAGGTLSLQGATLSIPPGALDGAVEIGMTRLADPEDAGYAFHPGSWVFLSPSGTTFRAPVSLLMRFDPVDLHAGATEENVVIFRGNPDGTRTPLSTTVDLASGVAIAFLDSFSPYFLDLTFESPIPGTLVWVGGAAEGPRNWHLRANWSPAADPSEAWDAIIPAGGTYLPQVQAAARIRGLHILEGASLELAGAGIEVHGTLAGNGPVVGEGRSVVLEGGGVQSVFGTVPDLLVPRGEVRLTGPLTVTGDLQVNGSDAALEVGAHPLVVQGNLETAGTGGRLVMDDIQGRVTVQGSARFSGGAGEEPTLRRGVLTLHGNLSQDTRPDALRASGNHLVVMAGMGTEQVVSFADPGPGGSYLAHLETRNTGVVNFARSARLSDLSWGDAGVGGRITVSAGHRLDVRDAFIRGALQAPELRVTRTLAAADGVPYLVERTIFAGGGGADGHQPVPDLDYQTVAVEGPDVRIGDPWVRIRGGLFMEAGNLRIAGNVLEVGAILATPGVEGGMLWMAEGDRVVAGTVDMRRWRPRFEGGTLWISGDLMGPEVIRGTGVDHRTVFHGTTEQFIVGAGGYALGQLVLANTGEGVVIRTPALQASGPDAGERFLDLVGNTVVRHDGDDHVSVGVAVFRATSRTHFGSPTDRAFNCVWALDENGSVLTREPGNLEIGCARFGDPSPRPALRELPDFTPPSRLEVQILAPDGLSHYDEGEPVTFQASATLGGAPVPASFAWFSSRDMQLGTGATLVRSDLSVGVHLVEVHVDATAPDGSTVPGSANVLVVIRGDDEEPPEPPVLTSIEVAPVPDALVAGQLREMVARGFDQFGLEMLGIEFTWQSSDACIVSVDAGGTAKAHSPGSALVTASSGGVSGSTTVEVAGGDPAIPASVVGAWRVCRRSTGDFLYEIEVTNQEESGRITGRVYHANGTSSFMSGNWGPTQYNMTWTRLVQGGERTFGINGMGALSMTHLRGSYNDRITLSTYDVELRRIPGIGDY